MKASHLMIYSNNVKGPVESVSGLDSLTKEIDVMGQTVMVNTTTYFEGTTWDTIAPNDVIEVSGFFDETGAIRATFIGKTGEVVPGLASQVTGIVDNLDTASRVLEINELTVDYSMADTGDLPGGLSAEGLFVRELRKLNFWDPDQIEVEILVSEILSPSESRLETNWCRPV